MTSSNRRMTTRNPVSAADHALALSSEAALNDEALDLMEE
jgi:hypothetical protein